MNARNCPGSRGVYLSFLPRPLHRLRLEALLVTNLAVLLSLSETGNCNSLECVRFHAESETDRAMLSRFKWPNSTNFVDFYQSS